MSRIGKQPIDIPQNVAVTVDGLKVSAKGPLGELSVELFEGITAKVEDNILYITVDAPEEEYKSFAAKHGLYRSLVNNIITGVSTGFEKELEIIGVGYRVMAQGKDLKLQVGFSHDVIFPAPDGITFEVPDQNNIKVKGVDKQQVGQVSANIRKVRPPEPYKGKGIRYKDEYVRRKAGKAGK
jgi:large subunit ribosomal protein L6